MNEWLGQSKGLTKVGWRVECDEKSKAMQQGDRTTRVQISIEKVWACLWLDQVR